MAKFDRFMVSTRIGADPKIRRLTLHQRWCFIAVLIIASDSPTRGTLLLAENVPADEREVATVAGVSRPVAKRALVRMRELQLLVDDDGADRVKNWDRYQVVPRSDPRGARRVALHRDRDLRESIKRRDQDRCRYCGKVVRWNDRRSALGGTYDHLDPDGPNTAENLVVACRFCNSSKGSRTPEAAGLRLLPEPTAVSRSDLVRSKSDLEQTYSVSTHEGKEKGKRQEEVANAPSSSRSGAERADREREKATDDDRRLCRLLAELARDHNPKLKVKSDSAWLRDMRLLRDRDGNSPAEIERLVVWVFSDASRDGSFWWADVIQSPGNLREHFGKMWGRMRTTSLRAVPDVEDSAAYLARRGAE